MKKRRLSGMKLLNPSSGDLNELNYRVGPALFGSTL